MDNHPRELTKVILSINICCVDCQNRLEQKLLKLEGVNTVATYIDENLVSVIGTMDLTALLDRVAKLGKPVKLLSSEKYKRNKRNHCQDHNNNTRMGGVCQTRRTEKGHNCCGHEVRHEHRKEEEHKHEAYVPPKIDERVCRSYYCPDHPKLRKILNRVPEESSTFFGGGLYSSGCNGYCGGYPCNPYGYPQGYTNMPTYPRGYPNMTRFGHSQPPRMRPFGFL